MERPSGRPPRTRCQTPPRRQAPAAAAAMLTTSFPTAATGAASLRSAFIAAAQAPAAAALAVLAAIAVRPPPTSLQTCRTQGASGTTPPPRAKSTEQARLMAVWCQPGTCGWGLFGSFSRDEAPPMLFMLSSSPWWVSMLLMFSSATANLYPWRLPCQAWNAETTRATRLAASTPMVDTCITVPWQDGPAAAMPTVRQVLSKRPMPKQVKHMSFPFSSKLSSLSCSCSLMAMPKSRSAEVLRRRRRAAGGGGGVGF
mmetsp:Transcript_79743/g.252070  ORF Transcript_79743/g.252070 Transcript_79743/m.252070 type:complete len:256 (-) Transcript_79743:1503-2270(-)